MMCVYSFILTMPYPKLLWNQTVGNGIHLWRKRVSGWGLQGVRRRINEARARWNELCTSWMYTEEQRYKGVIGRGWVFIEAFVLVCVSTENSNANEKTNQPPSTNQQKRQKGLIITCFEEFVLKFYPMQTQRMQKTLQHICRMRAWIIVHVGER